MAVLPISGRSSQLEHVLAISGFGLLLYRPRFILVLVYLFTLFAYFFLARNEEDRIKREQPQG